jgi:predicted Zn-dependent protease
MAPVDPQRRLALLEKAVSSATPDPFAWYGLAVEYGNLKRLDDALRTFTALRASHPEYLPMYLACGQVLQDAGRVSEAREWLEAGIAVSRKEGSSHARATLEALLSTLE